MTTNSNKSSNKMVRLAWDSPQMLMDTWNKWVHHALASIDVWERKKKDETWEIRESSSARGAGNKTVTARAAVGMTSTADASRYLWATNKLWAQSESTITCSAEPDSRGNVLSCRLRIWAHTQKCWKLADEDSQQIRKQATAALWTLSLSSYIPISHLLQHCQDPPSPALNLILSSSIFFVVVVAVVIFLLFLFKGKKKHWIYVLTAVSILGCCISFCELLLILPS